MSAGSAGAVRSPRHRELCVAAARWTSRGSSPPPSSRAGESFAWNTFEGWALAERVLGWGEACGFALEGWGEKTGDAAESVQGLAKGPPAVSVGHADWEVRATRDAPAAETVSGSTFKVGEAKRGGEIVLILEDAKR